MKVHAEAEGQHIFRPARRVRVAEGWTGAGNLGWALAIGYARQQWVMVLWDGEEDPDCFKAAGLEMQEDSWHAMG